MHRLYVGNIPHSMTIDDIRLLLDAHRVRPIDVQVKEHLGCAFIEFACQNDADRGVDVLGGVPGLKVEPATQRKSEHYNLVHHNKPGSGAVVSVKYVKLDKAEVDNHSFKQLIGQWGHVTDTRYFIESAKPPQSSTGCQTVLITYGHRAEAILATKELDGLTFRGNTLVATMQASATHSTSVTTTARPSLSSTGNNTPTTTQNANSFNARGGGKSGNYARPMTQHNSYGRPQFNSNQQPRGGQGMEIPRGVMAQNGGGSFAHQGPSMMHTDLPVRMLVDAKHVGAIIGQGGQVIREISKECKARCVVDGQRSSRMDGMGTMTPEKVVSIFGQPDNCSRAAIRILEIVMREQEADYKKRFDSAGELVNGNHSAMEPELKLRVDNHLVGRLIGKNGSSIRKIMEDTGCSVVVSNMSDVVPPVLERIITVKGDTLGQVSQGEVAVSQKLRQAFEQDAAPMMNQRMPFMPGGMSQSMYGALPNAHAQHIMNTCPIPYPDAATPLYMPMAFGQQAYPFSQQSPMMMPSLMQSGGGGGGATTGLAPHPPSSFWPNGVPPNIAAFPPDVMETVSIYVPNFTVGGLIGTKGQNIRQANRQTHAHIKIEADMKKLSILTPPETTKESSVGEEIGSAEGNSPTSAVDDQGSDASTTETGSRDYMFDTPRVDERQVTITGNAEQQYKAQEWIYHRVLECVSALTPNNSASNRSTSSNVTLVGDVSKLCVELRVPAKLVGRIIGKGGASVRDLQTNTGAAIKIPDDPIARRTREEARAAKKEHDDPPVEVVEDAGSDTAAEQEKAIVRVMGTFQSTQAAQAYIRQMVLHYNQSEELQQARPLAKTSSQQSTDKFVAATKSSVVITAPPSSAD